jgi:hypothetical protein
LRDADVFAKAAAFLRRSSFGRVRLEVDMSPWLAAYPPSTCPYPASKRSHFGRVGELAQDAAAAGYELESYDRLMYLLPDNICGHAGGGTNPEIMLAMPRGAFDAYLFVHELGHTFGLLHATRSTCAFGCSAEEYGDPWTPMGRGFTDFSAYEKSQLGWISIVTAETRGTYRIGSVDQRSALPQALVIPTFAGEYSVEHRVTPSKGLFVRVVRQIGVRPYRQSILLSTKAKSYVAPGVFSVRLARRNATTVSLAFSWIDRDRSGQAIRFHDRAHLDNLHSRREPVHVASRNAEGIGLGFGR